MSQTADRVFPALVGSVVATAIGLALWGAFTTDAVSARVVNHHWCRTIYVESFVTEVHTRRDRVPPGGRVIRTREVFDKMERVPFTKKLKYPTFKTVYDFELDVWRDGVPLKVSGDDVSPRWPDVSVLHPSDPPRVGDRREASRSASYWVDLIEVGAGLQQKLEARTWNMTVNEVVWTRLANGQNVALLVNKFGYASELKTLEGE